MSCTKKKKKVHGNEGITVISGIQVKSGFLSPRAVVGVFPKHCASFTTPNAACVF